MGTRRNSKWTIIKFFMAVPLMLMACSLSSVTSIVNKAAQVATQAASTTQQPGAQSTAGGNQAATPAPGSQGGADNLTPTAAAQAFDRTPKVQLPQSFTYADLTFSVTKADITN